MYKVIAAVCKLSFDEYYFTEKALHPCDMILCVTLPSMILTEEAKILLAPCTSLLHSLLSIQPDGHDLLSLGLAPGGSVKALQHQNQK